MMPKRIIIFFLCIFTMLGFCVVNDIRVRNDLKKQCGSGMDCRCFSNIVDYRLSKKQIRTFTKFLGEVKKYPTANILEFTDEDDAKAISGMLSLCRIKSWDYVDMNNHDSIDQEITTQNKVK